MSDENYQQSGGIVTRTGGVVRAPPKKTAISPYLKQHCKISKLATIYNIIIVELSPFSSSFLCTRIENF